MQANTSPVVETSTPLNIDEIVTPSHLPVEHKKSVVSFLRKIAKTKKFDVSYRRELSNSAKSLIDEIKLGRQQLTPKLMDECFSLYDAFKEHEKLSKMTAKEKDDYILARYEEEMHEERRMENMHDY